MNGQSLALAVPPTIVPACAGAGAASSANAHSTHLIAFPPAIPFRVDRVAGELERG
jgi:hypothetical protein